MKTKCIRRIFLATAIIMALAVFPVVPASAADPWRDSYAVRTSQSSGLDQFALFDMDSDGTPELFLESGGITRIYAYSGGAADLVGTISAAISELGAPTDSSMSGVLARVPVGTAICHVLHSLTGDTTTTKTIASWGRVIGAFAGDYQAADSVSITFSEYNDLTKSTALSAYEPTEANINKIILGGAISSEASSPREVLAAMTYLGDYARCRLTSEQARLYAAALQTFSSANFPGMQLSAFLWDIAGDGVPLLAIHAHDTGSSEAAVIFSLENNVVTELLRQNNESGSLSVVAYQGKPSLLHTTGTSATGELYLVSNGAVTRAPDGAAYTAATFRLFSDDNSVGTIPLDQFSTLLHTYSELILLSPTYSFPQVALSSAQIHAIEDALLGKLAGEATLIYKLADDLYYTIVTSQDSLVGGAIVREGRQHGNTLFYVQQFSSEPLAESALLPYIKQKVETPNIVISAERVASLTSTVQFREYLAEVISNVDGTDVNDTSKRMLETYIQRASDVLSTRAVEAQDNRISLTAAAVAESAAVAKNTHNEMLSVLGANKVELSKKVPVSVQISSIGLDLEKPAQIVLNTELVSALDGCDLEIRLDNSGHSIGIAASDLITIIEEHNELIMQIQRSGTSYAIVFADSDGGEVKQLPAPVSVTLPADGMLDTVQANFSGTDENWGGQYDAANNTIQFATPYSGDYEITQNVVDIDDIGALSEYERDAITFMVSKGFMSADGTNFMPGNVIDRYDFTLTLTRIFYALDEGLATSFTDVPIESEYYSYIASAEHAGIVAGIGGNLFGGEQILTREQALTIASNVLLNKRSFSLPANTADYIGSFSDATEISDWAVETVAMAVRDGLYDMGGMLAPRAEITRVEAATLLYKLFMLLYDTTQIGTDMMISPDLPPLAPGTEAAVPATESSNLLIIFIAGGAVVIIAAVVIIIVKKRR